VSSFKLLFSGMSVYACKLEDCRYSTNETQVSRHFILHSRVERIKAWKKLQEPEASFFKNGWRLGVEFDP
jgi:hypothetical protein